MAAELNISPKKIPLGESSEELCLGNFSVINKTFNGTCSPSLGEREKYLIKVRLFSLLLNLTALPYGNENIFSRKMRRAGLWAKRKCPR